MYPYIQRRSDDEPADLPGHMHATSSMENHHFKFYVVVCTIKEGRRFLSALFAGSTGAIKSSAMLLYYGTSVRTRLMRSGG